MKRSISLFASFFLCISLILTSQPTSTVKAGSVLHVTTLGVTSGTCGDWDHSCTPTYAFSIAAAGDEIWIAEGVYKPTFTTDQTIFFNLTTSVAIYGGFDPWNGDDTWAERNPSTNPTIFSGDVNGDDTQTPIITNASTETNNTSNSYHVMVVQSTAAGSILDGVTITGGYGYYGCAYGWEAQFGGGLYAMGAMTINNVVFSGNESFYGAGLYNTVPVVVTNSSFIGNYATSTGGWYNNGDSTVTNVTFANNVAVYDGAGLASESGYIQMDHATFTNNNAVNTNGGGFYLVGTATVNDTTFSGNHGKNLGGGMSVWNSSLVTLNRVTFTNNFGPTSGGGLGAYGSTIVLNDVTFSGNSSQQGGAIHAYGGSTWTLNNVLITGNDGYWGGGGITTTAPMTFNNVTLVNNTTYNYGGGLEQYAPISIYNSIIWGNTASLYPGTGNICTFTDGAGCVLPTISYSDVGGGWSGTGNISVDPLLESVADNGGPVYSRALPANSPVIDAGNTATCLSTDARGELRNDLGCDMGAYERVYTDGNAVQLSVSSSSLTTFGPALAGIQRDPAYADPGAVTITKIVNPGAGPESVDVNWRITPTVASGFNVTLKLCYTDAESNGLTLDGLRFYRYDAGSWSLFAGVPTISTDSFGNKCAQVSGVEEFSTWTLATATPTVVNLANFRAAPAAHAGWVLVLLAALAAVVLAVWLRRLRIV